MGMTLHNIEGYEFLCNREVIRCSSKNERLEIIKTNRP